MHRVEEQIMMYSVLVPEERQVLDAYVVDHPELVPLLEEAKSWTALFQEARMLRDAEPGDEALAYLVVTRRMSRHPLPRRLEQTFRALESRVAAQPALQARVATLSRRLAALEAASDPVSQFEALTGYRL